MAPSATIKPATATSPNLLKLPVHMAVPRMKGNVEYRLLNAGAKSEFSKKPTSPAAFDFPADSYSIDPLTDMAVEVRLTGRPVRQRDGTLHASTLDISFADFGYLRLTASDQLTYEFLERCSLNRSNPFRDKSVNPAFERVDHAAKAEAAMLFEDKVDEARDALKDMKADARARLGSALDLTQLTDEPSLITQALRGYLKKSPVEFLAHVSSPTTQTKAIVKQAIEEKVISFNEKNRCFQWVDSKGELLTVPAGVDAADHLTQFLLGDEKRGQIVLRELNKRLDAVNTGA